MGNLTDLIRHERNARLLFAAYLQSSVGNSAAYVALLLLAGDRFDSPWAISLVMFADFVPSILLGPVFGALADRFSRKTCMILGDVVRIVAFVGLVLVDSFAATFALAVLAGVGGSLFAPSVKAAIPQLVSPQRAGAGISMFNTTREMGWLAGAPLAALLLSVTSPETILVFNAATFGVSLVLVSAMRLTAVPADDLLPADVGGRSGLVGDVQRGIAALRGAVGVLAVIFTGGGLILAAAMQNVAEPLLSTDVLHSGGRGFALLAFASTLGTLLGTLRAARGGAAGAVKRRLLTVIPVAGVGYLITATAPVLGVAMVGLLIAGAANGVSMVSAQMLVQQVVPPRLHGRAFGLADAVESAAFATALLTGGAVAAAFDARAVLIGCAAGMVAVWTLASWKLRGRWEGSADPADTTSQLTATSPDATSQLNPEPTVHR